MQIKSGGVAKTTTVANLGNCLVRNGKKVLLIDFDPQADLTSSLGFKNADGMEHTEVVPGYDNYVITGDHSKSTWQEIIKSEKPDKLLPAYIKDVNEIPHYYKYFITEREIKGYTTTIETSKDGFTFTIINRHFALLPDTGGEGIRMFIIAGGLLLAFLLYTGRRRKRKQTM